MGKLKSSARSAFAEAIASEPITAQNYVSKAQGWIISHGGEGFVIVGPDCPNRDLKATPAQWKAWLDYFALIGHPTAFRRGAATVPTRWPEEFDATAPSSDPHWTPEFVQPHSEAHMAGMRARVSAAFGRLSKSLPASARAKPQRMTQAEADAHLAELANEPLTVSAELRERIAGGA